MTNKESLIQNLQNKITCKLSCYRTNCDKHNGKDTCTEAICKYADIITTCDGKYVTINNNGILHVLRNDEYWRHQDLIGDKYVLSLVQRIAELEEKYEKE